MCTVTWTHSAAGYELFCNRDEKRSRLRATGPSLISAEGTRFIAPLDGDAGGTWIGVNEHALTVCVLNGNPADGSRGTISRGLLGLRLLSCQSASDLVDRIRRTDLANYSAFTVVGLHSDQPAVAMSWNRRDLRIRRDAELLQPFTSSSFATDSVIRQRRDLYHRTHLKGLGYHASHECGWSAWSVCMHRDDAETVSFTRVSVTAEQVSLMYSPAAPCHGVNGTTLTLPRVAG